MALNIDWSSVDELLLDGRRLQAIQGYRELSGDSLADAIEAIGRRFELLAKEPHQFRVDLEGYWRDFYS